MSQLFDSAPLLKSTPGRFVGASADPAQVRWLAGRADGMVVDVE